jgi:archaemetzincin
MKIGILPIGQVAPEILTHIENNLTKIFTETTVTVINDVLPIPQRAFDKKRNQHNSSAILAEIRTYANKKPNYQRILGVIDTDIYASGLNYVFGEAYTNGNAALISLWRLKPQHCGQKPDQNLYKLRATKEATHEIGHTLGLQHCHHSTCVMHFSNSIFDTDKKQNLFCDQHYLQATIATMKAGNQQ